jgi:hypothetical protein
MAQITQGTVANLGLAGQWLWVSVGNRTLRALATTNISSRRVTVMIDDRGKVTISDPNAARPVLPPRTERFHQGQRRKQQEGTALRLAGIIGDMVADPDFPPPPGAASTFPGYNSRMEYWLYTGSDTLIPIPVVRTWTKIGQGSNQSGAKLSNFGISNVGSYSSGGAGLAIFAKLMRWEQTDSGNWTPAFSDVKTGDESVTVVIPNNNPFELWIRDTQAVTMALAGKNIYLYNAIAGDATNDRYGIFYYKIPCKSTVLPTPQRFSSYPGFVGASDDWVREYPNIATADPIPEANYSNLCFYQRYRTAYGDKNFYKKKFYYVGYSRPYIARNYDIEIQDVTVNSPTTCTFNPKVTEKKYPYTPPDLTVLRSYGTPDYDIFWEHILAAEA